MAFRHRMAAIFSRHPLLAGAFLLFSIIALFFGARLALHVAYWKLHEDEPVRPWMTVGYIGRSWDVKPHVIDEIAGLPKPEGRPLTLSEIARQRGVPVERVIADVEEAIARIKAERRKDHGH